jgi:predicted AlkP superfamily phosphohydrolase/phosphomutase
VSRVLVLGLDSADAELIERWADAGHLPALARLRRNGAWSRLGTTAEVMHVSAWPTIYTGADPGHHGLYHAYQARAGTGALHRTRAEWMALPPFWGPLDQRGRKCIVMDAFMDAPLAGFRGTQILEYGTWTWFSDPSGTPARIRRELLRRFGPYPAPEHSKVLTVPEPAGFRDALVAGARRKGEVVRWLLGAAEWDLAFIGFGEPHGAGHYLWHLGDPEFPTHAADTPASLANALRDVYAAVDEAIGSILDGLDPSTTVLVVSGDGMGPNYSGCHLLPEALHRLGLFHGAGVGVAAAGQGAPRKKSGLVSMVRQAIPLGVRQSVTRCLPRSLHYRLSMKWVNGAIDWERSRVYCIPNSNEGYLRVNLRGRDPRGMVGQGSEYADLLALVDARISELVEPGGRRATHRVYRPGALYPGSEQPHLPDLSVTWDPEARTLGTLESPACGRIEGRAGYQLAPYYSGNHRPTAFVGATGPTTSAGSLPADGSILDLAPTVFALLGEEPATHFQGRAWRGLART